MKQLVKETKDNLIDSYLGKTVLIHGAIYHYSGEVTAIDEHFVKLENSKLILNSDVDKEGFENAKDFKKGKGVILVGREMIEAIFEL